MSRAKALELLTLTLLAAVLAAAIPLGTGYFAWSWDALNHHIYLGMTAETPRWNLDVIPANYQTYQYPYLYWPAYRLSLLDGSGAHIGAIWSAFQAVMLLLPVWFISERLLPDTGPPLQRAIERIVACVLAFMSAVVLIGLETTASDPLAAVPLLWGIAISLKSPFTERHAFVAAGLWGVATAFKLSNGLFLPWLLVWWWVPGQRNWALRRAVALAAGAILGFGLAYAPWGWQLWRVTGNPFHPFFASFFGGA